MTELSSLVEGVLLNCTGLYKVRPERDCDSAHKKHIADIYPTKEKTGKCSSNQACKLASLSKAGS